MNSQGYVRVNPRHAVDAVMWWLVREYEDGFVYARGGDCRTLRDARKLIREHWSRADQAHFRLLNRPTHRLVDNGDLEPINYGAYDSFIIGKTRL